MHRYKLDPRLLLQLEKICRSRTIGIEYYPHIGECWELWITSNIRLVGSTNNDNNEKGWAEYVIVKHGSYTKEELISLLEEIILQYT